MILRRLLLISIVLCGSIIGIGQEPGMRFRHITIDDGLSNNNVSAILKDSKGFIWVGTFDGLNRYDGYEFQTINSYGEKDLKLSSNIINCLFESADGCLWVGTLGGGLNCLDVSRRTNSVFVYDSLKNSISSDHIFDIAEDNNGMIWIATGAGLNKYNRKDESFTNYSTLDGLNGTNLVSLTIVGDELWIGTYGGGLNILNTKTDSIRTFVTPKNKLSSKWIWDTFYDSDGLMWLATEKDGLCYYNKETGEFHYFQKKEGEYNFLNNNFPVSIAEDAQKRVWITTDRGGLYCYDRETEQFFKYRNNPVLNESIQSDALTRLLVDDTNTLWVGTYDKGFSMSKLNQWNIKHYNHQKGEPNSLSDKSVNCIYEDSDGEIWVGTENGLNRLDRDFNVIQKFDLENGLSDNVALTVLEVQKGEIWIGTYTGGISILNKNTGTFTYLKNTPEDDQPALSSDFIRALYKDSHGLIWIGTIRGGADVYDPETGELTNYPNSYPANTHLNSSNVMAIWEGEASDIWLITYGGGINKYERSSKSFLHFQHDKNVDVSLSSNQATCQLTDSHGNYWVGTNFGLNRMNNDGQSFTRFYMNDGLASNSIVGLAEDSKGNIWITTQNGLSIYQTQSGVFSNFYREDGLQENVFHYNAITLLKRGDMVCGGINGINVFNADIAFEVRQPHKVVMTGLSVLNQKVDHGTLADGRQIYDGHISEAAEVNLSHKDKLFELYYSTLEYSSSGRTTYQYKIDELHKEWINLGSKNVISFHSLPPDNYTFRIKSIITNGKLESEESLLKINIKPPFYLTNWFYVLVIIVGVSMVFGFYFIKNRTTRRQRIMLQRKVAEKTKELSLVNKKLEKHRRNLEKQVDERTKDLKMAKERAEKADALKTAFLANMSHEIRTPMNAILGFVDLLNEKSISKEESDYFRSLIQANGMTLMRLIDDIMDLARIESGANIFIRKTNFELREEIEQICAIYKGENSELIDGVSFCCNRIEEPVMVYTDPLRLKQIITNLINNAIKFTEEGSITFSYSINNGRLQCSVKDTGIGIPPGEIDNIFDRFNKLEGQTEKIYRGTGLGLAITKELIRLLGGTIRVESQQGKGSVFYFDISVC
ncbi:two-component regulator propeller domain-containing protein [Carboxylicivirga sp. RSCT41]|uniref:ligand-binding sensor domain-containing protein n=1 Tax=Carboxylicivirga agarovorans TaxID=3417570 RepID=UPI003D32FDEB